MVVVDRQPHQSRQRPKLHGVGGVVGEGGEKQREKGRATEAREREVRERQQVTSPMLSTRRVSAPSCVSALFLVAAELFLVGKSF